MSFFKRFLGDDADYREDEMEETVSTSNVVQQPAHKAEKGKPEFILIKPTSKDELVTIADSLMEGKTVVLNLELVSKETKRFVDFLSGVAYALKGQIKRIAAETFLVSPGGMNISGDIFDDFEEDSF